MQQYHNGVCVSIVHCKIVKRSKFWLMWKKKRLQWSLSSVTFSPEDKHAESHKAPLTALSTTTTTTSVFSLTYFQLNCVLLTQDGTTRHCVSNHEYPFSSFVLSNELLHGKHAFRKKNAHLISFFCFFFFAVSGKLLFKKVYRGMISRCVKWCLRDHRFKTVPFHVIFLFRRPPNVFILSSRRYVAAP